MGETKYYGACDDSANLHAENEHCKNWVPQLDEPLEPEASSLPASPAPPTYPKPCGICDGVIQSDDDLDWHGYGNCREIPDAVLKQLSPLKDANDALLNDSHRDNEGNLVIYLYRAQEIAKELARHSFGDGTQQRGLAEDRAGDQGEGWIPVGERLPDGNADVLIYVLDDYEGNKKFITIDCPPFKWDEEVTHWRPLPPSLEESAKEK